MIKCPGFLYRVYDAHCHFPNNEPAFPDRAARVARLPVLSQWSARADRWSLSSGQIKLGVAVPVQRLAVLGHIGHCRLEEIDTKVRDVRFDILGVFGIALGVTVLLSRHQTGAIARPWRPASAADRVRSGRGGGAQFQT